MKLEVVKSCVPTECSTLLKGTIRIERVDSSVLQAFESSVSLNTVLFLNINYDALVRAKTALVGSAVSTNNILFP